MKNLLIAFTALFIISCSVKNSTQEIECVEMNTEFIQTFDHVFLHS